MLKDKTPGSLRAKEESKRGMSLDESGRKGKEK
jgi:hypothetical protein